MTQGRVARRAKRRGFVCPVWRLNDEASVERCCGVCGIGNRHSGLGANPLDSIEYDGSARYFLSYTPQRCGKLDAGTRGSGQDHRSAWRHRPPMGAAKGAAARAPCPPLCPLRLLPLLRAPLWLLPLGFAERPHGAAVERAAALRWRLGLGWWAVQPVARFLELSAGRVRVAAVTHPHPCAPDRLHRLSTGAGEEEESG
jgi:hypothetical protein